MKFCPKCGIMLTHKGGDKWVCAKCGHTTEGKLTSNEKMPEKKQTAIVKKSDDQETLPVTQEKCPKCGNKQAYFWTLQTRAGDEAETSFYKCTKCDHTWRKYR